VLSEVCVSTMLCEKVVADVEEDGRRRCSDSQCQGRQLRLRHGDCGREGRKLGLGFVLGR